MPKENNKKIRKLVGFAPNSSFTTKTFQVSHSYARYWKKKSMDPYFHPLQHKVMRWIKFSEQ